MTARAASNSMIISGQLLIDPHRRPVPGWLRIDGDRIGEIGEGSPPDASRTRHGRLLVCPGFVDAHLHLPQIDAIGCDGLELLDWLDRIIFPAEERWHSPDATRTQIVTACRRMLDAGTLGFAAYLTSHAHGIEQLADVASTLPLRGIAGQVLMDRGGPDALLGHPPACLDASTSARLQRSVNPRFAIACSDELLRAAARRAGDRLFIQTHLAESRKECRRVAELFPDAPNYTAVYDDRGLLTPRTLLAHGVHLTDPEWSIISSRRSVVVHCPTANTFLRSGLFDLRSARDHDVRLALGSDVAAGADLAMPRVARAMIEVAKTRAMTVDPTTPIPTPAEVWTLITRGNADALGWTDAGRLEVEAAADLLVLELPFEPDEHLIGRLIYTWTNRYIKHRILAGRII